MKCKQPACMCILDLQVYYKNVSIPWKMCVKKNMSHQDYLLNRL